MIKTSSSLKDLDLSKNSVVEGYQSLKRNRKLFKDVSNEVYEENVRLLSDALRINNSISNLNLSLNKIGNSITKDNLGYFFVSLEENQSLKEFDLKGCNLNREDYSIQIGRLKSKMKILI